VGTVNEVTGWLWVTDIQSVRTKPIAALGIEAVVTTCQDSVKDNVSGEYHHFNMADGGPLEGHQPGNQSYELFEEAANCVATLIGSGTVTLVHCHAGVSRSVAVATAALAAVEQVSAEEAFRQVRAARPLADPHPLLWQHLRRYVEQHRDS